MEKSLIGSVNSLSSPNFMPDGRPVRQFFDERKNTENVETQRKNLCKLKCINISLWKGLWSLWTNLWILWKTCVKPWEIPVLLLSKQLYTSRAYWVIVRQKKCVMSPGNRCRNRLKKGRKVGRCVKSTRLMGAPAGSGAGIFVKNHQSAKPV